MRADKSIKQAVSDEKLCDSGQPASTQPGNHPHLRRVVQRHLQTIWSQPLHCHTIAAYAALKDLCDFPAGRAFILDSGCGTGKSTRLLATKYPDQLVIGADRSRVRLAKSAMYGLVGRQGNCVLIRAELASLWRLLARDGHVPDQHYLLYPNPWPKPGHLKKRWHGHPVFPELIALGGEIEMRCNWQIYAQEFATAASIVTNSKINAKRIQPTVAISPFEHKYLERQQALFSVIVPGQLTRAYRRKRLLDYSSTGSASASDSASVIGSSGAV